VESLTKIIKNPIKLEIKENKKVDMDDFEVDFDNFNIDNKKEEKKTGKIKYFKSKKRKITILTFSMMMIIKRKLSRKTMIQMMM
jgi:cytochrome c biogenesis factor